MLRLLIQAFLTHAGSPIDLSPIVHVTYLTVDF